MPHNFDPQEGGFDQEEVERNTEFDEDGGVDVGEAAEQFVAHMTKESDDTAYMSEAERRLDLASYYRQLLHGSLFESDDPGARQVEGELKSFAEGRLQVLLGIRPDNHPAAVVKPQFNDEEVTALRKFASMSEAEQRVLWALLATAARSKSVVGPAPVKVQQAPAKMAPVQVEAKRQPVLRRIAAPNSAPAPVQAAAPRLAPKPRQPAPKPASATPRPIPMPKGAAMEGVMQSIAASQSRTGEKMDEARRQDRGGEVFRG